MPDVSTLTLNNGVELPALGLGVFQTPPDETRSAVEAALSAGYRHIDTAAAYGNERQVGEAVHSSGLDRSEVFLETKIWISDYGYDETLHGFNKSARKLGVDQSRCRAPARIDAQAIEQLDELEATRSLRPPRSGGRPRGTTPR
jgi:diketogulonate reductase-like aldo/keto reductase